MPTPTMPSHSRISHNWMSLPESIKKDLEDLRKAHPKTDEYLLRNMNAISSAELCRFDLAIGVKSYNPAAFGLPGMDLPRAYFKAVCESLEGNFPHLYLDLRDYVTVGIGCNLDLAGKGSGLGEALRLRFFPSQNHKTPDHGSKPADAAAVTAEYAKVRTLSGRTAAPTQGLSMKLVLEQGPEDGSFPGTVNWLFQSRLEENYLKSLMKRYSAQWMHFPAPAKLALLSIAFASSVPGTRLPNHEMAWKGVDRAVRKFDFLEASKHAHFKLAQKENPNSNLQLRGAWQRILFEQAFFEVALWSGPDEFPEHDYNTQTA